MQPEEAANRPPLRASLRAGIVVVLLANLLSACQNSSVGEAPSPTPSVGPTHGPVVDPTTRRVVEILRSMHLKAFNPDAPPAKGSQIPGGLFINWRGTWDGDLATAPDETNIETTGLSDEAAGTSPRHDPLTDLVYLRNLYAYETAFPADRAFDEDISRIEPIVRAEFANYSFYRAWLYFQFLDLDRFEPGTGWYLLARKYVEAVFAHYYDRARGTLVDPAHQSYRTDYVAEAAAALVDAGQRFGRPEWTSAGRSASAYLIARASNAVSHLFPLEMVVGRVADHPRQNLVKVGAEAQLLDALLTVFDLTHDATVRQAVRDAVSSLYNVSLGIWDAPNRAFFFGVDADGAGLKEAYRETRQAWMLPLLGHLLRDQAGPQLSLLHDTLDTVRDRLWQPALQGYLYRVDPDFKPYTSNSGPGHTSVTEDFVSTEAMNIACLALESTWPGALGSGAP